MEFGPSASSALVLVLVLVLGWYVRSTVEHCYQVGGGVKNGEEKRERERELLLLLLLLPTGLE